MIEKSLAGKLIHKKNPVRLHFCKGYYLELSCLHAQQIYFPSHGVRCGVGNYNTYKILFKLAYFCYRLADHTFTGHLEGFVMLYVTFVYMIAAIVSGAPENHIDIIMTHWITGPCLLISIFTVRCNDCTIHAALAVLSVFSRL